GCRTGGRWSSCSPSPSAGAGGLRCEWIHSGKSRRSCVTAPISTPLRFEDSLGRGRVLRQLLGRTPRASHELAAAVRAAASQYELGAGPAEGALEGADASFGRLRREVAVTALAIGTKLKHEPPS